ncbi:molybdopterin molybdotransferase MoeA [Desulfobacula toluolica]|uniref:Molybdopterin molybdenumtransferase n=1 Tax=Desulfobacula toluolica (strain DSM 7467 / Tol2) TaxID=651182 RepID=K0NQV2_DESTT|nr:molybdopterin molybdotransferase MoeA [Desulfobacula toluolica]CCK82513.1 MoeA4: molybdopterin biosynthesis protein [Desulfobacula toluolica Tol2]
MRNEPLMGYEQALKVTLETISPLNSHRVIDISECLGRIISEDLYSQVNSPSIDASMKDGYAVQSEEIQSATLQNSVRLKIIGMAAAGCTNNQAVTCGTTVRILTGAKIPDGANAVLAEEFATRREDILTVFNTAEPGRNILPKGADIGTGELIAAKGSRLSPGMMGTLAAAGYGRLPVYHRPRVAILATGDELVAPGQPLTDGKLYASNMEMLKAWCLRYGMHTYCSIVSDKKDIVIEKIAAAVATHDAVITSGGAWTGDRDFVAHTLNTLGWKKLFHRIRMGPGKAVGFGILNQKPVFLLPGGPPSNLMAFLQIALPGLLRLAGHSRPLLPRIMVKLQSGVSSRNTNWTEFVYGYLRTGNEHTIFRPLKLTSRLKTMAGAQGVMAIPEGVKSLPASAVVSAQLLI